MKAIMYLLLFQLSFVFCFGQSSLTAKQIIEKSREAAQIKGLEAISVLKIIDNKGNERIRKTSMASEMYDNGDIEKRIIKFLSPADIAGTGMLIVDYKEKPDNMWIYLPAIRKSRRIVTSEKSNSFMGSEFTNADMSAPSINDFTYKLLGNEKVEGIDCYKIEVLPVDEDIEDEFGFLRKIIFVGKTDFVVRKSLQYDFDNELYKKMQVREVKQLSVKDKKYMATNIVIENLQNGRRSEMIMEQLQYNPDVKDEYFTLTYLEK